MSVLRVVVSIVGGGGLLGLEFCICGVSVAGALKVSLVSVVVSEVSVGFWCVSDGV